MNFEEWAAPGRVPEDTYDEPLSDWEIAQGWRIGTNGRPYKVDGVTVEGETFKMATLSADEVAKVRAQMKAGNVVDIEEQYGIHPKLRPALADDGEGLKVDEDLYDKINSPHHYSEYDLACIEFIKGSMSREEFLGYLKGTNLKYMYRYRLKGIPKKELGKAEWYLKRLIEEVG